jgi:hypothetical protein
LKDKIPAGEIYFQICFRRFWVPAFAGMTFRAAVACRLDVPRLPSRRSAPAVSTFRRLPSRRSAPAVSTSEGRPPRWPFQQISFLPQLL